MPPYAAELEKWWLSSGYQDLERLVDLRDIQLQPRQCGFAQNIQRRLRTFDHGRSLQEKIQAEWPDIRAALGVDYTVNPRRYINQALNAVFRRPEKGGMNTPWALVGLGSLDAMEIQRLRIMEATNVRLETGTPDDEMQLQVIETLNRTTSNNFSTFHLGFRIYVRPSKPPREMTRSYMFIASS